MTTNNTCDLYAESSFGEWLSDMPTNVQCNYSEYDVDMQGTRVTITFSITDEE